MAKFNRESGPKLGDLWPKLIPSTQVIMAESVSEQSLKIARIELFSKDIFEILGAILFWIALE